MRPRWSAQARRRVVRKGREYDPAVEHEEIAKVGQTAMALMEDIAEDEELPDGSKIEVLGIVASVRRPESGAPDDEDTEVVFMRTDSDNRLVQVGLFQVGARLAEETTGDDEE